MKIQRSLSRFKFMKCSDTDGIVQEHVKFCGTHRLSLWHAGSLGIQGMLDHLNEHGKGGDSHWSLQAKSRCLS